MTFRPLDTHVPLSAFNYVHLALNMSDILLHIDVTVCFVAEFKFDSMSRKYVCKLSILVLFKLSLNSNVFSVFHLGLLLSCLARGISLCGDFILSCNVVQISE